MTTSPTSIELYSLEKLKYVFKKTPDEILAITQREGFPKTHLEFLGKKYWKRTDVEEYMEKMVG